MRVFFIALACWSLLSGNCWAQSTKTREAEKKKVEAAKKAAEAKAKLAEAQRQQELKQESLRLIAEAKAKWWNGLPDDGNTTNGEHPKLGWMWSSDTARDGRRIQSVIQMGRDFTAVCVYQHPEHKEVDRTIKGTITSSGRVHGRLTHSKPAHLQGHEIIGRLTEKGDKIVGTAIRDIGGQYDFEWKIETGPYVVAAIQDISLKAMTKPLSSYSTTELAKLPLNKRMKYSVVVRSDISKADLKAAMIQVVKDESVRDADIDEIAVFAYDRNEDVVRGEGYTFGKLDWCPNGNWAGVTPEIASTNDRSTYKFNIDIKDVVENPHLAAASSAPKAANVIGKWTDKESAFPGVITFLMEGDKIWMTKTFADGAVSKDELVVSKVQNQTRYAKKERSNGDYFVIDKNGDLAWGDKKEGLWAKSKKIK